MMKPATPEQYIAGFPVHIQDLLQEIRETIKGAAPDAAEIMSYGMPAYKLNGMLVWFGGHTKHIGFYPRASGIEAFQDQLFGDKTSRGAVQFPVNRPLPVQLITEMVAFRVQENLATERK